MYYKNLKINDVAHQFKIVTADIVKMLLKHQRLKNVFTL
jgi:hypothetical protein